MPQFGESIMVINYAPRVINYAPNVFQYWQLVSDMARANLTIGTTVLTSTTTSNGQN
jgi:hypothetical protein